MQSCNADLSYYPLVINNRYSLVINNRSDTKPNERYTDTISKMEGEISMVAARDQRSKERIGAI